MPLIIHSKNQKAKPQLEHYLALNAKDGSVLVRIPAGEFEMGDGKSSDCLKHKIELSEYWMGVYCVTNRQYGMFVAETKWRAPEWPDFGTPIWKGGQCPAEKLDHPVVCVSWIDAEAYAKWAELSLPTEAQWEKAARGPQGFICPWGDEGDANKWRNSTNKGTETTARVWEYPNGTSGYGTMQQTGNVWEWCADWHESDYYRKSPAKDPTGPSFSLGSGRVSRGGYWLPGSASIQSGSRRPTYDPAHSFDNLGFRLVRNSPSVGKAMQEHATKVPACITKSSPPSTTNIQHHYHNG